MLGYFVFMMQVIRSQITSCSQATAKITLEALIRAETTSPGARPSFRMPSKVAIAVTVLPPGKSIAATTPFKQSACQ